jgi:hypothetical protein
MEVDRQTEDPRASAADAGSADGDGGRRDSIACGAAKTRPHDALPFVASLFDANDIILVRPTETWVENDKKRSEVDYRGITYCTYGTLPRVLEWHFERADRTRCNLFFGVCPRVGGKGKYDKAWQIRKIRALWADVDHVTVEESLQRCTDAGLPQPSIVVNSGHGVHVYWALDAPYTISEVDVRPVLLEWPDVPDPKTGKKKPRSYIVDPTNQEKLYQDVPANRPALAAGAVLVQDVLAGIADNIGGDHTTDVSRLLRIPGTMNRKDQRNCREPVPCELVLLDESRRYSFDAFKSFAENAPSRRQRDELQKVKLPTTRPMTPAKRDKLHELALACSTAADRSRADWALVCKAIEKGWDQGEVWNAVANVGKFAERGKAYFLDTWAKAESHTRRKILDKCQATADGAGDGDREDDGSEGESDEAPSAAALASLICADDHFAQDGGGKVYHFADGAYRPRGDQRIRTRVKAICKALGCDDEWSSRLASETVEYIRVDSPELWERPPADVLNVKNGLLNVSTLELNPHSPEWLFRHRPTRRSQSQAISSSSANTNFSVATRASRRTWTVCSMAQRFTWFPQILPIMSAWSRGRTTPSPPGFRRSRAPRTIKVSTSHGTRERRNRLARSCGPRTGPSLTTLYPTKNSTGCYTPGSGTSLACWRRAAGSTSGAGMRTVAITRRC